MQPLIYYRGIKTLWCEWEPEPAKLIGTTIKHADEFGHYSLLIKSYRIDYIDKRHPTIDFEVEELAYARIIRGH